MKIYQEDLIAAHEEVKRDDQEARWDNRRRSNLTTHKCWGGPNCPHCQTEDVWPVISR